MFDDEPASPPEHFGRYRLIQRIGKGGMAEVFRAYIDGCETFQSHFVIKRIRPEKSDSPEFVEMFCNEARICALLQHPNIVEVYDFGQIGGSYFMAMEYLRGRDLAAVMRALRLRLAAVGPAAAARIAHQVALGLDHAHGVRLPGGRPAEIVHRDVTPSNIMILRSGGVKVLDFGIAKAAAMAAMRAPAPGERKGRVRGKLAYLSPEQVRNAELDGRSDVFSLGVVLWEMLVGQRLFAGDNEFQTLRNVLMSAVPPPSTKRPEVPAALDAVVAKALARERDERPPTARAFADALAEAVPEAADAATDSAVGALLGELFGDDDLGLSAGRFTSTFTGVSDSSPELAAAAADAAAPSVNHGEGKSWVPSGNAAALGPRGHRRLALVLAAVAVVVGLALVASWREGRLSRAEPDRSRPADTASAGR
jgi:serine/threonine protein kinase